MQEHLSTIADAVEGLCDSDLTGLSDDELTDTMRRLEKTLRRASAVGHNLIVESVERSLPGKLGHKSVNKLLIAVLRISAADASARVTAAKALGTWHALSGEQLPADLPETAAAQRDGDIGPDHARAIREVIRKIPHAVSSSDVATAEEILAELARSATPEDVEKAGHDLLAHLNPDGDLTDEKDRKRLRGIRLGRQDQNLMTPISGHLDPETRALLDPILAKWARPGMNNPDDPESPTGAAEHPNLDRDQLAAAAGRDTRTAAQRNHDAFKEALRALLGSGILGSHRGLPVTTILTLTIDQLEQQTGVVTTASGGSSDQGRPQARRTVTSGTGALRPQRQTPAPRTFETPRYRRPTTRLGRRRSRLHQARLRRTGHDDRRPPHPRLVQERHHRHWRAHARMRWLPRPDPRRTRRLETRTAPKGTEYAGRTQWIPPPHIDPSKNPASTTATTRKSSSTEPDESAGSSIVSANLVSWRGRNGTRAPPARTGRQPRSSQPIPVLPRGRATPAPCNRRRAASSAGTCPRSPCHPHRQGQAERSRRFHHRTPRRRRPSPPPPPRATHPTLPAEPRRESPWRHSGTRSGTSSSRRLLLTFSGI
ncbi:hypothetical protein BTZ20_2127 [Rhodococcus sp. MTM3W5.2]|nr:hypothetical protein BTZ20_2127 [Rhodococcus sp. MTM3W5.2]